MAISLLILGPEKNEWLFRNSLLGPENVMKMPHIPAPEKFDSFLLATAYSFVCLFVDG
jgi:hypothetical protein